MLSPEVIESNKEHGNRVETLFDRLSNIFGFRWNEEVWDIREPRNLDWPDLGWFPNWEVSAQEKAALDKLEKLIESLNGGRDGS